MCNYLGNCTLAYVNLFHPIFLAKVSLQQTLKCLAVAGLILSHLMNGVMDCVQVQGLRSLSQVKLAGGSAVLSGNSHLQVLLGGGGNNLA